jgi:hypothetical protein
MLQTKQSRTKALIGLVTGVVLACIPVAAAHADTLTYTFTGNASDVGVFFGILPAYNPNANFTLTFTEDSSSVVDAGGGFYRLNNISGVFSTSFVSTALSDVTIVVNSNPGSENVDFYNANGAFDNGLGLANNSALLGYALASNVTTGPVSAASGNLTPTLGSGWFSASGDFITAVQFTGENSLDFTVTGATPEPSSLLLLLSGLCGGAALLGRRLKARA